MSDKELTIVQLKLLKEKLDKRDEWASSIIVQNAIDLLSIPIEPPVKPDFCDPKQIPDIFVKIHNDAGTYKVYGIDWMYHKFLVDRSCGLEQVPFTKCTVISKNSV